MAWFRRVCDGSEVSVTLGLGLGDPVAPDLRADADERRRLDPLDPKFRDLGS